MDAKVAKLALAEIASIRKHYEDYEDYAESFRAEGFRPQVCVHGRSLWTDADINCGACEDGYGYFDYTREAAEALDSAKRKVAESAKRVDMVVALAAKGAPISDELAKWTQEPVS